MIDLIPLLDASDFSTEVEDEMTNCEINTHYHGDIFLINWNEADDMPETQKWLVETFGEEIRQYRKFAIMPT